MGEKPCTDCIVFIDDSNLWISGQKAQGAKLRDADNDPRFRVDLGRLLGVLTINAEVSHAFLYGSYPPPNDTVWKAAREKNFNVKTYRRSSSGKEKEIDVAMAADIVEMKCEYADENSTFVIVTGDRDLKSPVEKVLKKNISVHLWSWRQSLSLEYRRLANLNPLLKVFMLDDVEKHFSYKSYLVNTKRKRVVDAKHAIVIKNVSNGKRELHRVANSIARLMRLFFVTSRSAPSKDTQDLIVEFPNTKVVMVLELLRKCNFDHEYCSYASYITTTDEASNLMTITNRFEALTTIDDESLPEAVESSLDLDFEAMPGSCSTAMEQDDSASLNDDTDSLSSGGSWVDVVRVKRIVKWCGSTPCRWGVHCAKASSCKYLHTDYEKEVFRKFPHIIFKYWKAKPCNKQDHLTTEQRRWCPFAHESGDSWCLKCKMEGHLTDNCALPA